MIKVLSRIYYTMSFLSILGGIAALPGSYMPIIPILVGISTAFFFFTIGYVLRIIGDFQKYHKLQTNLLKRMTKQRHG